MFDDAFRDQLHELLLWRRDVRRFRPDALPDGTTARLIEAACLAPSVGLSEPWRFVQVDSTDRRTRIRENFEQANTTALNGYDGERAKLYASLKLQGIDIAPLQMAVFADAETEQGHSLGRASMPETIAYSVVTAIHNLWLVARAEAIGVGWVSILDPAPIASILDVPEDWQFIAYLCLGYPVEAARQPELEREKWESRRPIDEFLIER